MLTLRFPQVSDFMVNQFKTMQTKKKPNKQTKNNNKKAKTQKNRNKNNKLVITERNAFCC